jgi:hypothetical protein
MHRGRRLPAIRKVLDRAVSKKKLNLSGKLSPSHKYKKGA